MSVLKIPFRVFYSTWYNGEHRHSGIGLMTPTAVHDGRASMVHHARQQVLSAAYAAHPERFVRKPPQPPRLPHAVWINPPKEASTSQDRAGAPSRSKTAPHGFPSIYRGAWFHPIP